MSGVPASKALAGLIVDITVHKGKNLVPKDRSLLGKASSDPYVKVWLEDRDPTFSNMDLKEKEAKGKAKRVGKTFVVPKNLNPTWDKRYRIELSATESLPITKSQLYLTLLIYDHDNLSSDDPMGTVSMPLHKEKDGPTWYPVSKGIGKNYCKNASGHLQVSLTVHARRVLSLVRGNAHPMIRHNKIHVGLAWDMEQGKKVDLDASCVAVGKNGKVLMKDTVYYGNLSNSNGSIIHSGDETTGETIGDDEVIRCHLDMVPSNVMALYFLLTIVTPGKTLKDIKSANVNFRDIGTGTPICNFSPASLGEHNYTAMFLVRLARDDEDGWRLCPIEEGDDNARDFGTLIPQIKCYTRDLIPGIRIDPHERFAVMRKNGVIRVKDYVQDKTIPSWVTFGLAWDITDGKAIDLDASAICLDENLNLIEVIFFNYLKSRNGSIVHSGDERSGASDGDDEKINFSLAAVADNVSYIVIVVNSYSGEELDDISRASCHLFDPETKKDIATYTLTNCQELDKHTGLIMGCLYRTFEDEWLLRIISIPGQGRTPNKLVDKIQTYLRMNPPPPPTIPTDDPEIDTLSMPYHVPHNEEEVCVQPISVFQQQHYYAPIVTPVATVPVVPTVVVPVQSSQAARA